MPKDDLDAPIQAFTRTYPWQDYVSALRSLDPLRMIDKASMGIPALEKLNKSNKAYGLLKLLRAPAPTVPGIGPIDYEELPK